MSVKNKIYNTFINQFPLGEGNPVIDGIPTPESYYQTYVFPQLAKIQASDRYQYDQFGISVAVSDTRIVVGAHYEDTTALNAGSAYIFDINGNQLAKIQASDAQQSDQFGKSVAASNTRIVVGALYENTTASQAGSAYIFDIDGNQIAKIQASDAEASDWFGSSVAVSNTRIVVGAPYEDTAAFNAGSAYIFDINGNQLAKIQASDADVNNNFGHSVSVSDTRIVVGAPYKGTTSLSDGAAYIFDIDGNQIAKIIASDAQYGDNFGWSVAVSDTRIVVGALYEDTNGSQAGSAYIFDINGNQLAKIQASDAELGDFFGTSVAVSDTRIVVGAEGEDTTASNGGSAYIFDIDGNQLAKKQASDAQQDDIFGHSVAVSDTRIVVGAPYEDTNGSNAGSAYIFQNDLVYKSDYNNNINNINFNKLKYRFTGKL
jgi:hypothetical protein